MIFVGLAALAATAQSIIMWNGRNSHVELNRHSEQVKACSQFLAKSISAIDEFGRWDAALMRKERIDKHSADVRRFIDDLRSQTWLLKLMAPKPVQEKADMVVEGLTRSENILASITDGSEFPDAKRQQFIDARDGARSAFYQMTIDCERLFRP